MSTKTAKPEDPVVAELAEDVVVDGDVLLPAGSDVLGHVVSAQRSGRVKGKARLVVSFSQVRTGGRTHRIDATGFDVTAVSSTGKDAKIAGGAAAAGVVIGAIADGGEGALKGGLIGGAAGGAAVRTCSAGSWSRRWPSSWSVFPFIELTSARPTGGSKRPIGSSCKERWPRGTPACRWW